MKVLKWQLSHLERRIEVVLLQQDGRPLKFSFFIAAASAATNRVFKINISLLKMLAEEGSTTASLTGFCTRKGEERRREDDHFY